MNFYWQDPNIQNKIINALQDGQILVTTTDTVPGLLANATQQGFDILNQIKGGRQNKPYIVLVSDISKLSYFVDENDLPQSLYKIISKCWPGPLTGIFKAKPLLPAFLRSHSGTIAIRCPNHVGLLGVLRYFDGLFSTSANKSSMPQPTATLSLSDEIKQQVGFVVGDKCEEEAKLESSTVLDFSSFGQKGEIYAVRIGAFPLSDIERIANVRVLSKCK